MVTRKTKPYLRGASPILLVLGASVIASSCQSTVDTGATPVSPTALTATQASSLYVPLTGATMSGALSVPTNDFSIGTTQFVTKSGNIGIGTANPGGLLDIEDTNRFDATGSYNSLLVNQQESPPIASTASTSAIQADAQYISAQNSPGAIVSAETVSGSTSAGSGNLGTLNGSNVIAADNALGTITTQHAVYANSNNNSSGTITNSYGVTGISTNVSTGIMTSGFGVAGSVLNSSTGTMTNAVGVQGTATNAGAGNITNLYGGQFSYANSGGATVTSSYGINVSGNTAAGSTTTTAYGVYVTGTNAGTTTTGYGVYVGPVAGTTAYGIYDNSGQNDYFGSKVGIGRLVPQATLDVNGTFRLAKNAAQPFACAAGVDGAIALTAVYTICICNGGTTTWVQSKDGATACVW